MASSSAPNAAKLGTVEIHGRGIDSSASLVKNMLNLIFLITWSFRVIPETLRNLMFGIYVRNAKNLAITVDQKLIVIWQMQMKDLSSKIK